MMQHLPLALRSLQARNINLFQKNYLTMARLTKSETDKMIFGVCGGLADYMNVDSTVMRVLFVLITFFGIGSPILVYLILALVMPKN